MNMKNIPLTPEQEEIFRLVSAFEDRENVSVDAYFKEVAGKTSVNKLLLREYLIASYMSLLAGQGRFNKIPKLSKQDIDNIKSELHKLQEKKPEVRKIEPIQRMGQIRYAASSKGAFHKPKKGNKK